MWKPDIVIYHGSCNDGFGAAYACWKKWGYTGREAFDHDPNPFLIEYVPMGYGGKLPAIAGKNVLFVDFSLKRDAMIEAATLAKSIVVLDHHKTAEAELEEWNDGWVPLDKINAALVDDAFLTRNVVAIFDMEKSGARLAWEFCHPECDVPMMLQYIEDRDLWRFALDGTHEFTKGLSAYPQSFEYWDKLFQEPDVVCAEGRAIARYHDKMVHDACQNAYEVNIAGHRVMAVNVPYFLGSDAATWLLQTFPKIPFAAYWLTRGDGVVQWGLRSTDERMDVSEIAKKFGGGGHRNASGFAVPAT